LPWIAGRYTLQLVIMIMTYSILSLAFALCWKVYLIRMDLAAYWGIGAYTSAILMTKAGWPYWPTFLAGGLIAALVSWGLARLAVPRGGLIFVAVGFTLAIAIQTVLSTMDFFGGLAGIPNVPPATIGSHIFGSRIEFYFLGLFLLILNIIVYYLLYNSRVGRAFTAIGTSPSLAASLGINPIKYRIVTVIIGSFFAALSGTYYLGHFRLAFPQTFGFTQSIYIQMYAVLGGLGHFIAGPLVGASILTLVPEYLRVAAEFEPIVTAVILILIVIFMPGGILGLIDRWRVFPRLAALIGMGKKSTLPPLSTGKDKS
jgi:branched-chain amino acid transport system permease protein